ncbi:hypothetical protein BS47DRAFT_1393949 [Hydnum rufescens UP504]|uniref:C3H1-type domain-containing protein n=1 Tax=Hydnum rufescens UP504 TaxID=1448309 RepID=A0A9P6AW69_9AGAM|nr:hypothetical protein BS47DRAFT_1393949 [Hydnum rufescens UP504]
MVSPIWKVASEGDLEKVKELLNEPSSIDIEIKDHTGATPLIQAVRNGHRDVVKELLQTGGANPFNPSSQGRPETYTTDQDILSLLADARSVYASTHPEHVPSEQQPQSDAPQPYHEPPYGPPQGYYRPVGPPGPDAPYQGYYLPEGAYYVPPPPVTSEYVPPVPFSGQGMPPPEITKTIPCRYFPACRYGASCAFAHPQPAYYSGSLPPHQYPPYDPNSPVHYPPPYYQGAPNFPPQHVLSQPPSSLHHDGSPPPQGSAPDHNGPFSPPPSGYVMAPVSPTFIPTNAPPNGAQPHSFFPGTTGAYPHPPYPPTSPTHQRRESFSAYPYPPYHPQQRLPSPSHDEIEFRKPPRDETNGHHPRDPSYSSRREVIGLPSVALANVNLRHLACFSLGKMSQWVNPVPSFYAFRTLTHSLRSSDDCRFQHIVLEDGQQPFPRAAYPFASRSYRGRGFPPGASEDKKGDFEVKYPHYSGVHPDKAAIAQQLASLPSNIRSLNLSNSHRNTEKGPKSNGTGTPSKQRIPNADDFPSLNGSIRSTTGSVHSVSSGKTAAQILKSSPPTAKARTAKEAPRSEGTSTSGKTTDLDSTGSSSSATGTGGQVSRPTSPEEVSTTKTQNTSIEVPPVVM